MSKVVYLIRYHLEVVSVEIIWIEITLVCNKRMFWSVYTTTPPNSSSAVDQSVEESVDLAFNTGIVDKVLTGDFIFNPCNATSKCKLESLCAQYSLQQCIEQPTHFTENLSSLLDFILVSNTQSLVNSGVIDPFLDKDICYHCPVYASFKYIKPYLVI